MSNVKNYVHCVWGTKRRYPYFNETNTKDIMAHILNQAREKNIWIDHLNAYQNHIHCLISLQSTQTLAEVIKHIKGGSSHWINQNINLDQRFSWATDYYATSVSLSIIPIVRLYIQNQASHHRSKTWSQEEQEFESAISNPGLQAGG